MASPAWLAVTEQVPLATKVRVEPSSVQIAGVVLAKLTLRLLLAVALKDKVPDASEMEAGGVKVIV